LRGHAGDQHVDPEGEALVAGAVHHDVQIGEQVRVPVARQHGKLIADLGRPLLADLLGIAVVATEPLAGGPKTSCRDYPSASPVRLLLAPLPE
jgi:hypothetical protein